jgi:hypothetical protein
MEQYSKGLDEAGKGFLHLLFFENRWFDESFCQSEIIEKLNYDDVNIIEVTEESADRVNVRYEIIFDDGSSEKTSIDVEKVNGDWKVAGQPYIMPSFGW